MALSLCSAALDMDVQIELYIHGPQNVPGLTIVSRHPMPTVVSLDSFSESGIPSTDSVLGLCTICLAVMLPLHASGNTRRSSANHLHALVEAGHSDSLSDRQIIHHQYFQATIL